MTPWQPRDPSLISSSLLYCTALAARDQSRAPSAVRRKPVQRRDGASCSPQAPWTSAVSSYVGLDDLVVGPPRGIFGRHALHSLGVHVHDDVLAQHLRRLAAGRPGITHQSPGADGRPERLHDRVLVPQRMLLPIGRWAAGEALLRDEPFLEDRLGAHPSHELLCGFLVFRIAHQRVRECPVIAELTGGGGRQGAGWVFGFLGRPGPAWCVGGLPRWALVTV